MKIAQRMRRRRATKALISHHPKQVKDILSDLLSVLPDWALFQLADDRQKMHDDVRRGVKDWVKKVPENISDFFTVTRQVKEVLNLTPESNLAAVQDRVKHLSASMKRIIETYSDAEASGHRDVVRKSPEIILEVLSKPATTAETDETFLGVMFLDRQVGRASRVELFPATGFHPFVPVFSVERGASGGQRWITQRILDNPGDPLQHWEDYRLRKAHVEQLRKRFNISEWNHDVMCDYSEELLQRLDAICAGKNEDWWWAGVSANFLAQNHSEHTVNEILTFGPPSKNAWNYDFFIESVGALHHYDKLPPYDDYTKAPARVQSQCRALVAVHVALNETYVSWQERQARTAQGGSFTSPGLTLSDPRFVDLILDNPERGDYIVSIIRDRGLRSYEDISALVENSSTSVLEEGAL